MTEFDHMFAGGLLLLCALLAMGSPPKQADSAQRWGFYQQAWLTGVGLSAVSLLVWHVAGRQLLTYGWRGWLGDAPAVTSAIAAVWTVGLMGAVILVSRGFARAHLVSIYSKLGALMPKTRKELYGSWGAAVSAGVGEEIAFRGFLMWYIASLAGWPTALLCTSVLFGIAHGYQRVSGVVFAALAGLLLGAAFLISGSLLLAIWLHASYNIASFTIGRFVLTGNAGDIRAAP